MKMTVVMHRDSYLNNGLIDLSHGRGNENMI